MNTIEPHWTKLDLSQVVCVRQLAWTELIISWDACKPFRRAGIRREIRKVQVESITIRISGRSRRRRLLTFSKRTIEGQERILTPLIFTSCFQNKIPITTRSNPPFSVLWTCRKLLLQSMLMRWTYKEFEQSHGTAVRRFLGGGSWIFVARRVNGMGATKMQATRKFSNNDGALTRSEFGNLCKWSNKVFSTSTYAPNVEISNPIQNSNPLRSWRRRTQWNYTGKRISRLRA